MIFVHSVVSDIPVDSEAHVATSLLLRIRRISLRKYSYGRVRAHEFIGVNMRALGVSKLYYIIKKDKRNKNLGRTEM